MTIENYLLDHSYLFILLTGLIGFFVGYLLNIIIYRLPLVIEAENYQIALEILGTTSPTRSAKPRPFTKRILLSRYLVVELITCALSVILAIHFGPSLQLLCAWLLTFALITLFFIDNDTMLLPDQITLPILWLGLFFNIFSVFTPITDAVLGAIFGYLFFYLMAYLMLKIRKTHGLGGGDLKLISLLGAWFGWQILPIIIFIASFTGALFAAFYIFFKKEKVTLQIPFGPFLTFAGFLILLWGRTLYHY
ncbi:MAG: prepilin peptidase [Gammaproteobacteria bacterium]|nr:prepilin peptidase [Gammaproteobacteria bacterium]